MFFRCCASLVLALIVSTCASSAGTSLGEEGEPTTGNLNLIVRAELDRLPGQSAWGVVSDLRPGWIRQRVGVRVNGIPVGEGLGELGQLRADDIESMRFLSGIDARVKYGRDFSNGVIEVTMIGGG